MRIKQTLLLLLFASLLLLCGSVSAQTSTQMIQLDQSSFRPTYTDALTGVNIDPIGKDSSRRPCARIKVHVNRMTREDINQIELRIVTNNEQIKCKTADYDNGLIIELTAKPDTRFYFHHDKFGDSNEVLVNLEADKEYRMEAFLNILYPITVQSNASDVEVYIDENFVGVTGENRRLGIQEVLPGKHHLYCRRGDIRSAGQEIFVSAGDTFFVENIDIEEKKYMVTFNIDPVEATIAIDGLEQYITTGTIVVSLTEGKHQYSVRAEHYQSTSGEIVVNENMERSVLLTPLYGSANISSDPEGASVYIDGNFAGKTPFMGENIQAGRRRITISKSKYDTFEDEIVVNEDKTTVFTSTLNYISVKYQSSIDLSYTLHFVDHDTIHRIGLSYIGGLRTRKSFFIGLGVGLEYTETDSSVQNSVVDAKEGRIMEAHTVSVPIFLHLRGYMGKRYNHFIGLSAGGKFFGKGTFNHFDLPTQAISYSTNGVFGELGYGVVLGKFCMQLVASTQTHPYSARYNHTELVLKNRLCIGGKFSVGFTF